mgnify:CR=1 FL=1
MNRPLRLLAAAALALTAAAGGAWPQAGPDDGPDLVLIGSGGPDWLVACRGETIEGAPLRGEAGGPNRAGRATVRFNRVGYLSCRIEAGAVPLMLTLEKYGGEAFCPLTGRRGGGACSVRFAARQTADFEFEAVP